MIVVVSAVDGVEVQTEIRMGARGRSGPAARDLREQARPRARGLRAARSTNSCRAFGTQVAPFQLPIGEEHDFSGIADLLHEKADLYPSGPKAEESEWPDDLHAKADPAREKLTEAVAEADDALIEKYLESGELPEDEIVQGVKAGFAERALAPVIVAAARQGRSASTACSTFIADEFPSPLDRAAGHRDRPRRRGARARAPIPTGPLTALVFKTVSDPFVGHITMFRVFCGRVRPGLLASTTRRRTPRSASASCSR